VTRRNLAYTSGYIAVLTIFAFTLLLLSIDHIEISPAPTSQLAHRDLSHNSGLVYVFERKPKSKMPYTIVSFETRKPELTPLEFQEYYDNVHVPIIKQAVGSSFPDAHTRYYLKRQPDGVSPLILIGTADNVDYDALVIMTFESEQQLMEFQTKYGQPEIAAKIGASAEKFIISSKLTVLGLENPHVTRG
jgi:hypothetical protein